VAVSYCKNRDRKGLATFLAKHEPQK